MISFQEWLLIEGKTPWIYHVTLKSNLSGIAATGLKPGGGPTNWIGFEDDTKKQIFFCQNFASCLRRYDVMEVNHRGQVVMLRFKLNKNKQEPDHWQARNANLPYDPRVMTDTKDMMATTIINPAGIQLWNGQSWISDLGSPITKGRPQVNSVPVQPVQQQPTNYGDGMPRFE